jgi:hypothetical protein
MPLVGFNWRQFIQGSAVQSFIQFFIRMVGGEIGKETEKAVKEKLPFFLGLSLKDEQIYAGILARMDKKIIEGLNKFLATLKKHQKNMFRHVVVGIDDPDKEIQDEILKEKIDNRKKSVKVKKTKDEEIAYRALAMSFIKTVVEIYEENPGDDSPDETDPEKMSEAKKMLLNSGIILEKPLIPKDEILEWAKKAATFFFWLCSKDGYRTLELMAADIIRPSKDDTLGKWIKKQNSRNKIKRFFW